MKYFILVLFSIIFIANIFAGSYDKHFTRDSEKEQIIARLNKIENFKESVNLAGYDYHKNFIPGILKGKKGNPYEVLLRLEDQDHFLKENKEKKKAEKKEAILALKRIKELDLNEIHDEVLRDVLLILRRK